MNMAFAEDEDKPWKTDLAKKAAQRRDTVVREVEEIIKTAGSFEDALKVAVETLKKRFARYSAITAYVADGEDLVVHTSIDRPAGPERVWTGGGPLAEAAHADKATVVSTIAGSEAWNAAGLSRGSVMVAPVRTVAGLWAILEVWSDFRDAFSAQDVRAIEKIAAALAAKTPAA